MFALYMYLQNIVNVYICMNIYFFAKHLFSNSYTNMFSKERYTYLLYV